jgi:hypothetical protein
MKVHVEYDDFGEFIEVLEDLSEDGEGDRHTYGRLPVSF